MKPRKVDSVVAQTRRIMLKIMKSWKHQISSFNAHIKFDKHNEQGESLQEWMYDKLQTPVKLGIVIKGEFSQQRYKVCLMNKESQYKSGRVTSYKHPLNLGLL